MTPNLDLAVDGDAAKALLSEREQTDLATGLKHPRDIDGHLWPWAFRNATKSEMAEMDIKNLLDVCYREETDWVPEVLYLR